jgi:hypothetical protein
MVPISSGTVEKFDDKHCLNGITLAELEIKSLKFDYAE